MAGLNKLLKEEIAQREKDLAAEIARREKELNSLRAALATVQQPQTTVRPLQGGNNSVKRGTPRKATQVKLNGFRPESKIGFILAEIRKHAKSGTNLEYIKNVSPRDWIANQRSYPYTQLWKLKDLGYVVERDDRYYPADTGGGTKS